MVGGWQVQPELWKGFCSPVIAQEMGGRTANGCQPWSEPSRAPWECAGFTEAAWSMNWPLWLPKNLLQTHRLSTSCGVGWPGASLCWDSFLAVLPCHISVSSHQSHPGWGQETLCDHPWCHGNDPCSSEHISCFWLEGSARGVVGKSGGEGHRGLFLINIP